MPMASMKNKRPSSGSASAQAKNSNSGNAKVSRSSTSSPTKLVRPNTSNRNSSPGPGPSPSKTSRGSVTTSKKLLNIPPGGLGSNIGPIKRSTITSHRSSLVSSHGPDGMSSGSEEDGMNNNRFNLNNITANFISSPSSGLTTGENVARQTLFFFIFFAMICIILGVCIGCSGFLLCLKLRNILAFIGFFILCFFLLFCIGGIRTGFGTVWGWGPGSSDDVNSLPKVL